MAKKRKEDDQRDSRDGDYKRRKAAFAQRGQITGPGILLTTVRRKERKAGLELIEFLDDLVDDLYPDLDLSVPEPAENKPEGVYEDDDDLDALKNGTPPPSNSSIDAKPDSPALRMSAEVIIEDDVAAQIEAELEELRSKVPNGRPNGDRSQDDDNAIEVPRAARKRFTLIDPEVECLMFVSVAWPMDPVKLCCALLDQVARTGQVRGHFIQRLSPVYVTGRADGVERVEQLAREVIEKHCPDTKKPTTYKVDPRIRLHNQLHKMDIIKAVATAVPPPLQADLTNPDLIINVEVLKMTVGIGILPKYDAYKRYNPQMIAQQFNQDHNNTDGLASRTLLSAQR